MIDVPTEVMAILPQDARFSIMPRHSTGPAIPGRLRLIEPVADSSTRSHRLRITLEGEAAGLRLGSMVSASLDIPTTPVLTLSRKALLASGQVWRIGSGRRAEAVSVTLGAEIGDRVIVKDGLKSGDEVLIRGIHSIEAGQTLGERIEE